mgnify:CR=1 FL=1
MARSVLTVVTPASVENRRLCTLAQVEAELGLADGGEMPALNALRDQVSAAIANWCGHVLAEEVVRETWRGRPETDGPLLLRRFPVTAIASVTEGGVALAATDYELDAEAGRLWRLRGDQWAAWGGSPIQVQYTAGWRVPDQANATLPADIQRAAVLAVVAAWEARGRDPALRSINIPDVAAETYLDPQAGMEALPPVVAGLLQPYRVLSV